MAEYYSSFSLSVPTPPVCLCKYVHHILFMHSSISGHLGYFHLLATVNSAAMSLKCTHICLLSLLWFQTCLLSKVH